MSAPNVSEYYHRNIPKGKFGKVKDAGDWNGAAPASVTVVPGTGQSIQIKQVILRVADTFAMSVGDSIDIVMDAYGSATHYSRTISQATPLLDIIRLGDPDKFQAKVIGGVNYYIVVIPFEPSAYLRSSEVPSESLTFTYNDVGGGVTAGQLLIDVDYWETAEDDSGIL